MKEELYSDADMSTAFDSGVVQGHADMAYIVDRCARYRRALEEIANENRVAYTATTAKTFSVIAFTALQEETC